MQYGLPYKGSKSKIAKEIIDQLPPAEHFLERMERLQSLESLQRLESLERLQSLQRLQRLESLQMYSRDYQAVEIADGSVIYCDIPYRNTDEYIVGDFDHERFYKWACDQKQPVYISEYWMPEDRFECVWSREKVSTLGTGNNRKTVEKLFIPRK